MAKDTGKKAIVKKSLKVEKKATKSVAVGKAPQKAKVAQPAKDLNSERVTKAAKFEKTVKAPKQNEKPAKTAKKETEVKAPSLLSKLAGKLFKSELSADKVDAEKILNKPGKNLGVSKSQDLEPKAKVNGKVNVPNSVAKASDGQLSLKPKESKKPKEEKPLRDEILEVVVAAEPGELTKKQSKKALAAYQAATEEEAKWLELKEKYKGIRPSPYKMSEVYQEKTLLDHKVLGLGVILSVVNDRLEVLFQTGTKHLISNYKK
jgi:hypothetical protein